MSAAKAKRSWGEPGTDEKCQLQKLPDWQLRPRRLGSCTDGRGRDPVLACKRRANSRPPTISTNLGLSTREVIE